MSEVNGGTRIAVVITTIIVLIMNVWIWWFVKSPFNLHSYITWLEIAGFFFSMGFVNICVLVIASEDCGYEIPCAFCIIGVIFFLIWVFGAWFSSGCFHAKERYSLVADMVEVISDEDERSAFPNLLGSNNDTSNLPLIGIPEAIKNAETQMGKQPALGSQFELLEAEVTSQNIGNSLMYVIPLEPKSWLKWDNGNHGYFIVDRNNGKTTFVEDSLSTTEKAPFGDNAKRIIYKYMRKNNISGLITELSPEVDEEGNFKYVATVYKTSGINGFHTVTGIVELDAMTQDCQYYDLENVPEYVDRVFPEEFFDEYLKYYGSYKNGWFNSFIGQKEVLEATDGSDIVYIDGICYYYTGYTSAGKGESSNGIMMMNCRTGEIKYYVTYGISESKAQGVAEGRVQEKEYKASYPLLLMIGGQETYLMLMRDASNNLCGYSFVSYKDYNKAAVADTLSVAQESYIKAISTSNSADILDNIDISSGKAAITSIGSEVKEGNTIWYVTMEGNSHIFSFSSELEPEIVFAKIDDIAEVTYIEAESKVVSAITIKIQRK